jgi:hypothetical protein
VVSEQEPSLETDLGGLKEATATQAEGDEDKDANLATSFTADSESESDPEVVGLSFDDLDISTAPDTNENARSSFSLLRGVVSNLSEETGKKFDPNSDAPLDNAAVKATYSILVNRVRDAVQSVTRESLGSVIYAENYQVTKLCFALEGVLKHGLMQVSFFGATTYWDYLLHLANCMPDGGFVLQRIKQTSEITTDLGRGRAWLRVALNDQSLAPYLKALLWEEDLTNKYYHAKALMQMEDEISLVLMLLESLSNIQFSLSLNDSRLNMPDCWELLRMEQETASMCKDLTPVEEPISVESVGSSNDKVRKKRRKLKASNKRAISALILDEGILASLNTGEEGDFSLPSPTSHEQQGPLSPDMSTDRPDDDFTPSSSREPSFEVSAISLDQKEAIPVAKPVVKVPTVSEIDRLVMNTEEAAQYLTETYTSSSPVSGADLEQFISHAHTERISSYSEAQTNARDPRNDLLELVDPSDEEYESALTREFSHNSGPEDAFISAEMVPGDNHNFFLCIQTEVQRARESKRKSMNLAALQEDDEEEDWLEISRRRKEKLQQKAPVEEAISPAKIEDKPVPVSVRGNRMPAL